MNKRSIHICAFFVSLLSAAAFGPTVRKGPELQTAKVQTLALLPAKADPDLRRERVDYVRKSILRELTSSGYVILDDAVVSRVCKDPDCVDRALFKEKYKVDGLVALDLKSLSRVNFGAGYYNNVSGELKFLTADSKELLAVEHTESERGGLVFNSGQIVQALIETYENTGDDSFNKLADRFAKTVVLSVPKPSGGAALSMLSDVNITRTEITPLGDSRYRVCVTGNPGATTNFVVDRRKTPLRENRPGEYCGAMLLGGLVQPTSKVSIEMRSVFGVPAQQSIDPVPLLACMPKNLISRERVASGEDLRIGCLQGLSDEDKVRCESELRSCSASQFYVYRADSIAGPYARVGQVREQLWNDAASKSGEGAIYAVIAVSKNGGASLPVTLLGNTTEKIVQQN